MKLVAALLVVAGVAYADSETDAEHAFRDALAHEDIAALEQLGAQRPLTRWSDDAWSEAARIAVRRNELDRARNDFQQVIAIGSDEQLVRRARGELERLGAHDWDAVTAAFERVAPAIHKGGDPKPALAELERLAAQNPRYPRMAMLMVTIAQGWEREGEADRAIDWLRRAKAAATTREDRQRVMSDLARTQIRAGELAAARAQIDELAKSGMFVRSLEQQLTAARWRRAIRCAMWSVLALLAIAAVVTLRRSAGSWRAALRRLARPPIEVWFFVPIGAVLVAIAFTGNPLIARTVLGIVVGGIATSWISGALLEGLPRPLRWTRVVAHAALAVVAMGAATYLAVDRGHVIDLVIETWKEGPER